MKGKRKVLITGASGFIGRHLCKFLFEQNYEVYGIGKKNLNIPYITYYKANVLNLKQMENLCQNKDYIIHLAGVTAHEQLEGNPLYALQVNLIGTYNLLRAFYKSNANVFIYPSSGKVYGTPFYLPFDEKHPLNPTTILGKTKKMVEEMIETFSLFTSKCFVILRIFNVYGPGQKDKFLIPKIIKQLHQPEITLFNNIADKRDFIYIDDLLEAISVILRHTFKGMEVFNIGTGHSHSAEDIIKEIEKIIGEKKLLKINKTIQRRGEFREEKANIEKISSFGWHPSITITAGLKKVLEGSKQINR